MTIFLTQNGIRLDGMKANLQFSLITILSLFICGCRMETVKQDPTRAVSDTNQFLKALYFDKNFDEAFRLAAPTLQTSATPVDLENMVKEAEERAGAIKSLKAESYRMTPGKSMELFYVGTCEKGSLYHRLVLEGDASGYKVSGVWFQPEPYPDDVLRRKFREDLFVKRDLHPAQ